MPCCLFYHLASQLDPEPFKRVSAFGGEKASDQAEKRDDNRKDNKALR